MDHGTINAVRTARITIEAHEGAEMLSALLTLYDATFLRADMSKPATITFTNLDNAEQFAKAINKERDNPYIAKVDGDVFVLTTRNA